MAYNNWKLMDKLDVAVRTGAGSYGFTGYIVEHGDAKALESAKDWARTRDYDYKKKEYTQTNEPKVHTFDNNGFTATILDSAGGSSQGGRLSFWRCEVEKDGVKFTIGVNDAILADLIKNSDITKGVIKEKLMFARKGGQPGLIHEGMQAYTDATADMKQKADLKSAKKTSKWEIGGIYSTLTQTDICLGEAFDTLEEYQVTETYSSYSWGKRSVTKFRKAETPKKTLVWVHFYNFNKDKELPKTLEELLKKELADGHIYFSTGKPPARAKASQLDVKETDLKLIDKMLALREEYGNYGEDRTKGRYVRELK